MSFLAPPPPRPCRIFQQMSVPPNVHKLFFKCLEQGHFGTVRNVNGSLCIDKQLFSQRKENLLFMNTGLAILMTARDALYNKLIVREINIQSALASKHQGGKNGCSDECHFLQLGSRLKCARVCVF